MMAGSIDDAITRPVITVEGWNLPHDLLGVNAGICSVNFIMEVASLLVNVATARLVSDGNQNGLLVIAMMEWISLTGLIGIFLGIAGVFVFCTGGAELLRSANDGTGWFYCMGEQVIIFQLLGLVGVVCVRGGKRMYSSRKRRSANQVGTDMEVTNQVDGEQHVRSVEGRVELLWKYQRADIAIGVILQAILVWFEYVGVRWRTQDFCAKFWPKCPGFFMMVPAIGRILLAAALLILVYKKPERVQGFVMALFSKKQRLRDWEFVSTLMTEQTKHLLLGISVEGMLAFLAHEDVKFIVPRAGGIVDNNGLRWIYNEKILDTEKGCQRPQWHEEMAGPIARGDAERGLGNVQGYDLQRFIAAWLSRNGCEDKSVLEVIDEDERFEELRKYVGPASVFWSHIQLEDALFTTIKGIAIEEARGRLPRREGVVAEGATQQQFFWLDYFCLRQCQSDFDVHVVLGLIRHIGCLVAAIDNDLVYVTRSFCILEAYAACAWGETELLCYSEMEQAEIHEKVASCNINSKDAQTRSEKDKKKIDDLITNGSYLYDPISFVKMDGDLRRALLASADSSCVGGMEVVVEEVEDERSGRRHTVRRASNVIVPAT